MPRDLRRRFDAAWSCARESDRETQFGTSGTEAAESRKVAAFCLRLMRLSKNLEQIYCGTIGVLLRRVQ